MSEEEQKPENKLVYKAKPRKAPKVVVEDFKIEKPAVTSEVTSFVDAVYDLSKDGGETRMSAQARAEIEVGRKSLEKYKVV